MTTEQREAIDRLQELVNLRKRKNNIKHDTCICSTEDLDTVLSLVKEQEKEIDLMAEKIVMTKPINCTKTNEFSTRRVCMSKEEIKQYFERKVEDVES